VSIARRIFLLAANRFRGRLHFLGLWHTASSHCAAELGRYGGRSGRRASRSSKQLPTNQRDTDNADKHETNEIHPEDCGVCFAYDPSIAASTK
jgi:hypothetical protein